jgi:AraC-like DNA-binding protein
LLNVVIEPGHSFSVRRDTGPAIDDRWHVHEKAELIHFKKGSGTVLVGDREERFHSGDVVLVGAGLPHCRRFDEAEMDVRTVHFGEQFWGATFLGLPENVRLNRLLDRAGRGLRAGGEAKVSVAVLLERLLAAEGMSRLLLLLETLQVLAGTEQLQPLASVGYRWGDSGSAGGSAGAGFSGMGQWEGAAGSGMEQERISVIYAYSFRHFRRPIQLEEIASVAHISPNSFCRFFKSRTRKTYSRFLIEIRVGHACKLLIENNLPIKQLCYESGFNNFTSFYKYFKLITGKSPLDYQKEFMSGYSAGRVKGGRRA